MTRITKETSLKILGDVPNSKYFYCTGGRVVENLPEMELALIKHRQL